MTWNKNKKEISFEIIIDKISKGMSLRNALKEKDTPCKNTFYKWLDEDENKMNQYARAREERAELIFEDILFIADDVSHDTKTVDFGEATIEVTNHEAIQRSRLRIDARKWMLSKMQPKKYGDKIQHSNDPENPLQSIPLVLADGRTYEDLKKELKED